MSLWTPGGEREVPKGGEREVQPQPSTPASSAGFDPRDIDPEDLTPEQQEQLEAMAQEMSEVRQQLASVPASTVVANHAMGLYELAAIHLSSQPPNMTEGKVAIDAMAGLVGNLEGRLGENEPVLRDALSQLQLAFVQLQDAAPNE